MVFSRATTIINIGHLPEHTTIKSRVLADDGFPNVIDVVYTDWETAKIKELFVKTPDSVCLFGGAAPTSAPELIAELTAFLNAECPGVIIYQTTRNDFDEGIKMPPTVEDVGKSAVNIARKLLREAGGV